MQSESQIEKAVCDYATRKGCYVRKFSSPAHKGVPDRLFIAPGGKVFFVEFKAPGKVPTALQEREMREIKKRNGSVYVIDTTEKGKDLIDYHT